MRRFRIGIDSLSFGGNGVGRADGKVCFVPFSCPGDDLLVEVTTEKKSYLLARIIDIVKPSDVRVEPICPLFGKCGGCDWQNIDYRTQLEAKRVILADALWRGCRAPADLVAEAVAAPYPYGYRSRVQFKVHYDSKKLCIGFFRTGTHFVEDAPDGCPIAIPLINEVAGQVRRVLQDFRETDHIPQITIECGSDGAVATIHYIGSAVEQAAAFFTEHAASLSSLNGLFLQSGRKSTLRCLWGSGEVTCSLSPGPGERDYRLSYCMGGFSQANHEQNAAMLRIIRGICLFHGDERLLDLYCGNGNLSIPLSGLVASVTGIEGFSLSIASAVDNCRRNGVNNANYSCCDASAGVRRLVGEGREFEIVILDPPRAGAGDVVKEVHQFRPRQIVYVSCDPATLARDCGILAGCGYRVRQSIPIDMFPQTYHIESITLLEPA